MTVYYTTVLSTAAPQCDSKMKVSDELTSLHAGIDSIGIQHYLSSNANLALQQPLGSVVAGVKGIYL